MKSNYGKYQNGNSNGRVKEEMFMETSKLIHFCEYKCEPESENSFSSLELDSIGDNSWLGDIVGFIDTCQAL